MQTGGRTDSNVYEVKTVCHVPKCCSPVPYFQVTSPLISFSTLSLCMSKLGNHMEWNILMKLYTNVNEVKNA